MDPEVKTYFEKSMKKPTVLDKIRYKVKLMKLRESDIDSMRGILIKEAKPLFIDFWLNRKEKNSLNELIVKCFNERIMSLPKKRSLNYTLIF